MENQLKILAVEKEITLQELIEKLAANEAEHYKILKAELLKEESEHGSIRKKNKA